MSKIRTYHLYDVPLEVWQRNAHRCIWYHPFGPKPFHPGALLQLADTLHVAELPREDEDLEVWLDRAEPPLGRFVEARVVLQFTGTLEGVVAVVDQEHQTGFFKAFVQAGLQVHG